MASRGPPVLQPFRGFEDPYTIDQYLLLFRLQTTHLDSAVQRTELLRCLSPEVVLPMGSANFDWASSYEVLTAVLRARFARPRRSVAAARREMDALRLKPGQGVMSFVAELTQLASDCNEDVVAGRVVSLLFEALPQPVKLALGGVPEVTETLAALAGRADRLLSVCLAYPEESTSAPALALGHASASRYPEPRSGNNRTQGHRPMGRRPVGYAGGPRPTTTPGPDSKRRMAVCWHCNKVGHRREVCYSFLRGEPEAQGATSNFGDSE
jgi:hypothetical protein